MSDKLKKPVASVKLIKAKFPKAPDSFIIKAMEDELNEEEMVEEYAKSMEETVAELVEEVAALTAKAAEMEEAEVARAMEEEEVAKAKKAMDDEDEPVPAARGGLKAIANAGSATANPKAKWDAEITAYVAKGKTQTQAVIAVNRANPGLRAQAFALPTN